MRQGFPTSAALVAIGLVLAGTMASSVDTAKGRADDATSPTLETLPVRVRDLHPGYYTWHTNYLDAYNKTGDPRAKMLSSDAAIFDALSDAGDRSFVLGVWTVGEPVEGTVIPTPSDIAGGQRWMTINRGRSATADELAILSSLGDVVHSFETRPKVAISVENKTQVADLAALPFVYLIGFYGNPSVDEERSVRLTQYSRGLWEQRQDL